MTELIIDFDDPTLFGNDAGEDEDPELLNAYFVEQPSFSRFLNRGSRLQIAKSRKGMGKSALLSKLWFDLRMDESDPVIVRARGANLIGVAPPPQTTNPLVMQNYWQKVICARINYELGMKIGFAFTDNSMALVESAEVAGFKARNLVGSLLSRIKSSKIPIEVTAKDYNNHEELLKRASASFEDREVWVLIDDIDATFVNSPEHNLLVSTFFSACRAIVREVRGLSIRASVRTDVWTALRKNEDLDKCEQYFVEIKWSPGELKEILARKIAAYVQRTAKPDSGAEEGEVLRGTDAIISLAFGKMKWGGSWVPPFRPIQILSAGRPRWMSQLCRLAGTQASRGNRKVIGTFEINHVLPEYSRLRLSDIYKEHDHQFPLLQQLIETFSNGPPRYTTEELVELITARFTFSLDPEMNLSVDGHLYHSPMQLCHLLYKIGFFVGRVANGHRAPHADFVRYEQRPELLHDERNPDDGLVWEVHPSYREALNIGKKGAQRTHP